MDFKSDSGSDTIHYSFFPIHRCGADADVP